METCEECAKEEAINAKHTMVVGSWPKEWPDDPDD
jgi:hypothetical protein